MGGLKEPGILSPLAPWRLSSDERPSSSFIIRARSRSSQRAVPTSHPSTSPLLTTAGTKKIELDPGVIDHIENTMLDVSTDTIRVFIEMTRVFAGYLLIWHIRQVRYDPIADLDLTWNGFA